MKLLYSLLRLLRTLLLVLNLLTKDCLSPLGPITHARKVLLDTVNDSLRLRLTLLHHGDKTSETCGFARVGGFLFRQLTLEVLDAREGLSELV